MRDELAPGVQVAAVAARQHGVVAVGQLRGTGLDKSRIGRQVQAGYLHPIHRGVYAVGHQALTFKGRALAAVFALNGGPNDNCGDKNDGPLVAVSHRSAAGLWGLLPVAAGPIDVVVSGRGGRARRRGVSVHRPLELPPTALTRVHGIPVTIPARTIADLRPHLPTRELRRAKRQAAVLGLRLENEEEPDRTRSELEDRFLLLCHRFSVPRPEVNARVGTREVDFLWRNERLIVETDGYRYHRGRDAFEDDRERDLELRGLGFEVVRLSYRQVERESGSVARVLRERLGAT